jgi:flagellar basal body-associated protein FliL
MDIQHAILLLILGMILTVGVFYIIFRVSEQESKEDDEV